MDRWRRRIGYYIIGLVALMTAYAVVYQSGMVALEGATGTDATLLHAFQVVVETFTTTGFGSDAPWDSTFMNVLVIMMDLTGTAAIFLALPVLLFPALEEALSTSVPRSLEEELSDHVIIASYSQRTETLVEELDDADVDWVIADADRERARTLYEDGYDVVNAAPDSIDGLEAVDFSSARALVANVSDKMDTSIVLTAKELDGDVTVVSVVDEPDRARYHRLAGADVVLSPRPLLGKRLAEMVTGGVVTEAGDGIDIGEEIQVAELLVHQGSQLAGLTLAETDLRERTGVNVIGAWVRGDFETPVDPDATLEPGTILVVTGEPMRLRRLAQLPKSAVRQFERGETIVVGFGQVGQAVAATLDGEAHPYTVIDREGGPDVDVAGDASDVETLREAGIDDARSAILAIPDDEEAEFATLVMRDQNHDLDIAARAEEAGAVRRFYRAGANYALSLAAVTGRMIAAAILEDAVVTTDTHIKVVRQHAPGLAGQSLGDANVPERTDCTIIAVDRDEEMRTDLGPTFRFRRDDQVVIAGTNDGLERFEIAFGRQGGG